MFWSETIKSDLVTWQMSKSCLTPINTWRLERKGKKYHNLALIPSSFQLLFLWLSRFHKNKNSINCLTCMMIWVLYYLGLVISITKSSWHKMSLIIASESYMAFLEVRNGTRGPVSSPKAAVVGGTHALQLSCTTVGASRRRRRGGGGSYT